MHHLSAVATFLIAGTTLLASGCSGFNRQSTDPFATHKPSGGDGVVQASYEENVGNSQVVSQEAYEEEPTGWDRFNRENMKKQWKKMTGRGPNNPVAREAYAEGEQLFQQKDYASAAKKFGDAADRWPDSALEEDAMFMQAESLFFADKYSKACDVYGELMRKYVNTRHLDTCVRRQFAIAHYWAETDQQDPEFPITPNVVDKTRPWFDTHGNAIKAFDDVRLNDPRGPLADDAIMATANAFFLRHRWADADYYYKLIRTDYPKSEFQIQAHLLGLQSKMKLYQGPQYDKKPLLEAEELIDQMLVQFPTELGDERERIVRQKGEVRAQLAFADWERAQYYEQGKYYGAAKSVYRDLAKDYPGTEFARRADERIAALGGEPESPPDRFAFLNTVFGEPSGKAGRRR